MIWPPAAVLKGKNEEGKENTVEELAYDLQAPQFLFLIKKRPVLLTGLFFGVCIHFCESFVRSKKISSGYLQNDSQAPSQYDQYDPVSPSFQF